MFYPRFSSFSQLLLNHSAAPEYQGGIERFKYVNKWVFATVPNVHYAIEDMIAEGDMVACRITCSGTHEGELWGTPTGKRFSVEQSIGTAWPTAS